MSAQRGPAEEAAGAPPGGRKRAALRGPLHLRRQKPQFLASREDCRGDGEHRDSVTSRVRTSSLNQPRGNPRVCVSSHFPRSLVEVSLKNQPF